MYFAIILVKSKIKLVVPVKHVYGLDLEKIWNCGIIKKDEYLIYFSNYDENKPNF